MKQSVIRSLAAVLLLTAGTAAGAEEAAGVLVRTAMARRGSLPVHVTAFGTAGPAADGGITLSMPSDGQVIDLAATPGEIVHAGDKLLDFAFSAQAVSTYRQAVAGLALARQSKAHVQELFEQQLATRDQVEQADKAILDAQATLDALRPEADGKGIVPLKAPFDGIVTAIPVAPGDRTSAGAPLVNLMRADGLVLTVGIEPSDRAQIHKGDSAKLQSLDGKEGALDGKVLRVDGMINAKSRLIDADISLPPGALSGQAFQAVITVGALDGWLVPRDSVQVDGANAYLLQIADDRAVKVNVRTLDTDGDITAVEGPIDPGRPIVVEGSYQLSDGMAVRQGKTL